MSALKSLCVAMACSIGLAACTTVTKPVPVDTAIPLPSSRAYAFQTPSATNNAAITATRDVGFGCYSALYINGKLAGRFDNAETMTFYVPPGEVLMRYGRDPDGKALCGAMQDYWATHETRLHPHETKRFRLTIVRGGQFVIQRGE